MKIYNALSKSFTDEVKTIMGVGKSIDDAFEEVKMSIFGSDLSPTPTPEPIDVNELTQGDGEENGYKYVDLGLSVKWATCNVGGTSPLDEGLLFQFGRVDGYRFNDTNHQFRTNAQNKQDTGNEFTPKTATGTIYDKGAILGSNDDAAHVNMEGNWRMAKESDFIELLENTTHDVVKVNGVKGMIFTSNKNGHQLFIPFMKEYWNGNSFTALYNGVLVWSSQVYSSYVELANVLRCFSGGDANVSAYLRGEALSVRGVFQV